MSFALETLPDLPRWVEARGMLLSGRGSFVQADPPDPLTMVCAPSVMLAVITRWDHPEALERALRHVPREFSIVAPFAAEPVLAAILPKREREPARLFQLPPSAAVQLPAAETARLLRADEHKLLENLPPILRGELIDACRYSPIACAFVDDRPVSFCYCGWETETHWDVSIDTLESDRGRGLGIAATICLLHHFARAGKTAVWGAADSNPASARLATKLGFSEVDRLVVVYPDDAHE
jgi:hypothetical protein